MLGLKGLLVYDDIAIRVEARFASYQGYTIFINIAFMNSFKISNDIVASTGKLGPVERP